VRLAVPDMDLAARISAFRERFEALNGNLRVVPTRDAARLAVDEILNGRSAIASNSRFWPNAASLPKRDFAIAPNSKQPVPSSGGNHFSALCAGGDRTLVLLSTDEEQRLVSLLPPAHIAVIPASRILVNLDELLQRLPLPADFTSALIFITGPSRTADIEQILVRGVHGPGEVHVVIVEEC